MMVYREWWYGDSLAAPTLSSVCPLSSVLLPCLICIQFSQIPRLSMSNGRVGDGGFASSGTAYPDCTDMWMDPRLVQVEVRVGKVTKWIPVLSSSSCLPLPASRSSMDLSRTPKYRVGDTEASDSRNTTEQCNGMGILYIHICKRVALSCISISIHLPPSCSMQHHDPPAYHFPPSILFVYHAKISINYLRKNPWKMLGQANIDSHKTASFSD